MSFFQFVFTGVAVFLMKTVFSFVDFYQSYFQTWVIWNTVNKYLKIQTLFLNIQWKHMMMLSNSMWTGYSADLHVCSHFPNLSQTIMFIQDWFLTADMFWKTHVHICFSSVYPLSSFIYLIFSPELVLYLLSCIYIRCSVLLLKWPKFPTGIVKDSSEPIQYICFSFLHSCWPDLHVIVVESHVRSPQQRVCKRCLAFTGIQWPPLCLIQNS